MKTEVKNRAKLENQVFFFLAYWRFKASFMSRLGHEKKNLYDYSITAKNYYKINIYMNNRSTPLIDLSFEKS